LFTKGPQDGILSSAVNADGKPAGGTICRVCNSRYEAEVVFCPKDGTKLEPDGAGASASLEGQVLGERYRVLRKLGEGGMGEVYEASHVYIDKKFAIKLLRPEITGNPEAVARFHQEARSASSIGHENIIGIDDFGRLPDGAVYFAMELLEGESLADRMKDGPPLRFEEYLGVTMQVCAGLSAAHAKGIIHRDMKPANIFLTQKQGMTVVKILDFGIAKVGGDGGKQALTRTGQIFGTPQYMSPEQALGKPLDGRSDIYSVGVIMYELATGRVPFEAETFMGILTQHITGKAVPPSQAAPERGIPPQFERVIERAMDKDPGNRYASMEELAKDLHALATEMAPMLLRGPSQVFAAVSVPGLPVPSGSFPAAARAPSGPLPAAAVEKKSGAGMWIGIGLAGLVLAGGAGGWFLFMKKPPPLPVAAKPAVVAPPPVAPAGPKLLEVVVDSEPSGARMFADGKPIAETPDVVKVPEGKVMKITLSKSGSIEKTVTVDPAKERKMIIKLEPIARPAEPVAVKPSKPSKPSRGSRSGKGGAAAKSGGGKSGGGKPSEVLDPYQ
jgi:eukaryotic-like serine/threonine-protein kinase